MKFFIGFLWFSCFLNAGFGQEMPSLINKPAPVVVFQKSLDKPVAADFYKGKVLVLDFWATWCAPCIATFPEFNKLSKKYNSNDVVFASITDEPENTATRFFKRTKKELNAIKLSDTSRKTADNFNVLTIPHCVVIDKNNMVRWEGASYDLKDDVLNKIIRNEAGAQKAEPIQTALKPENKPIASRALFSFSVAPSDSTKRTVEGNSSANYKSNYLRLDIVNSSLEDCLQHLTGFNKSTRIITNDNSRIKQMIDIDFKAGRDTSLFSHYQNTILVNQARKNFILTLLGQAMKFDASVSQKKQKHYELIITDSSKLHTFKSVQDTHSSFSNDYFPKFEIVGYNLKAMAVELESSLKTAVITNIQDSERYDLSLNVSSIETANKSLQFHGLKLKEVNDAIPCLTVNFY
ncbi:MAG: TlpA family protein disulfide reductase [Sphingobacteriaceae bacterium]|nr:MAG: TlpA family protein disulfide reductase [Sphingobacteriaceae bacterium]